MTGPAGLPTADAALALEVRGVRQAYRTHLGFARAEVLHGVDLTLARGGTLGLAGPNGSGKTTLLRLVVGVERPTGGEVRVLGLAPEVAARRGLVGWLPEDSPFPPELSLRAALRLIGSLQGLAGRELDARVDALLERVGLAAHGKKHLGRCSRGMLRRFGLAQAWIHRPALVVLDEPTAGLDAEGFEVLAGLLDEARADGTTVVIASHLATDLTERCDQLAVLLGGRVAAQGPPRDVLRGGGLLELYRRHAAATP